MWLLSRAGGKSINQHVREWGSNPNGVTCPLHGAQPPCFLQGGVRCLLCGSPSQLLGSLYLALQYCDHLCFRAVRRVGGLLDFSFFTFVGMPGGLVQPDQDGVADRAACWGSSSRSLMVLLGTFLPVDPLEPDVQIMLLGAAEWTGRRAGEKAGLESLPS